MGIPGTRVNAVDIEQQQMSGYCQVLAMTGNKTPNVSMTFAECILH
jgi:hypothetical protein